MMLKRNIKKILLMITAVLTVGTVSAQKKVVKKKPKPVKIYVVPPPPPVVKTIHEAAPPSIAIFESKAPMISVSPQEDKYEREKICTDCDTLVLEAGKPHIVIYDVKWMSDRDSRTYRKQPTESDLTKDYYGMRGLVKREWDELQLNFPAKDVNYHHIYRNTFIKVPNVGKQDLSLLNRQERHEGFLFWNGKPDAKILQSSKMAQLTEQIAKATGVDKTSSYYSSFMQDSLAVEKLTKTTKANEEVQPNMNAFLQDEILREYILPFQFMDLKNVSSITLQPNGKEKFTFKFNTLGQWVEFIDGREEHNIITYQNNLPFTISEKGTVKKHFYYQGNTISVKDPYQLKSYKLIGKVFFDSIRYATEKKDYENLQIKSHGVYQIVKQNGQTCLEYSFLDNRLASTICYSNNQYTLPLTLTETFGGDLQTRTFSLNEDGALQLENVNKYKSSKRIYKLENGIIKAFYSTQKRGEGDYASPSAVQVTYTFFK